MIIEEKSVVTMEYTLTNDDGKVLDTSEGREPLSFIQGVGNIIPGLDKEMLGKKSGDKFTVRVKPEEGYGERVDEAIQVVPKEQFAEIENLEVGLQLQAQAGEQVMLFTIAKIEGDQVTIDGNHPLAGVPLNFDVEIVGVRTASEEELSHGHVHL